MLYQKKQKKLTKRGSSAATHDGRGRGEPLDDARGLTTDLGQIARDRGLSMSRNWYYMLHTSIHNMMLIVAAAADVLSPQ